MDVDFADARELTDAYAAGRLSPVEVTERALARARELQPMLGAMARFDDEIALAAAAASARRWEAGRPASALDGVPVTVKENIAVAGRTNRSGSAWTSAAPAAENAPVVDRLVAAGLPVLGTTHMPDSGCKGVGDSPFWGVVRNPWDPALTPGGSSSGAAAGLTGGIVPLAVGSDGGGSIRMPAAFCGIAGLKPTFGRVPALPGSRMNSLSHQGPMARSVADVGALFAVLADHDPRDPLSWPAPPPRTPGGGGPRVGIWRDAGEGVAPSADVAAGLEAVARALAGLGWHVDEVSVDLAGARAAFDVFWESGCAALVAVAGAARDRCDPELLRLAERGARHSGADYAAAMVVRQQLGGRLNRLHADWDVIVSPVTATPAFAVGTPVPAGSGADSFADWSPWTYPFNLTGQPALVVPAGLAGGLPVAVQVVGARHDDERVLEVGAAIERAVGGFRELSDHGTRLAGGVAP